MQIYFNPQVRETSFGNGKIIHPKYKKIERRLGKEILDEFKGALADIEPLKKSANIKFKINASSTEEFNGFGISVSKPAESALKRFLGIPDGKPLRSHAFLLDEFYEAPKKLSTIIVERVTEMVKALNG